MLHRIIPSSGESLPVIGLGSWIQFDVGDSEHERAPLRQVLSGMRELGGTLLDASPMYGRAESVLGQLTSEAGRGDDFFHATKVWTEGRENGILQMEASMEKMRRPVLDLIQVHNLLDWQTHLPTLQSWKAQGRLRYTGITHYQASYHAALEKVFLREKIDFVQFNYSIATRHAEERLLKAAADQGLAVIINEPFEKGKLFEQVRGKALPDWAAEYGIENWAQYFLKFILAQPAVTCIIPGTSDPANLASNMAAGLGPQADQHLSREMIRYFEKA